MNLEDLPKELDFLFTAIGQSACTAHRKGMDKKFFVSFCSEMWETMMLNSPEKFEDILKGKMMRDIKNYTGKI